MKKYLSILVALALATVGFVSCGDDNDEPPTPLSAKFVNATNVTSSSATLNGTYTGDIERACFTIAKPGTMDFTWKVVDAQFADGKMTAEVKGLDADESYPVIAYVKGKDGKEFNSVWGSFTTEKTKYDKKLLEGKWVLTNGRGFGPINYEKILEGLSPWPNPSYYMEITPDTENGENAYKVKYYTYNGKIWGQSMKSYHLTFDGVDMAFTDEHPEPFGETKYVNVTYLTDNQLHLEKEPRDLGGGNTSTENEYYRRFKGV